MSYIDTTADILNVSDLTDRVDELETERDDYVGTAIDDDSAIETYTDWATDNPDDAEELAELLALLDDLCGNGGDRQWRGDWYPGYLIRDSYTEDYARQTAEDCGLIADDAQWPTYCIDWEQATRDFLMDYSAIDIDGVTYWYR
jgi:hypothetical protein